MHFMDHDQHLCFPKCARISKRFILRAYLLCCGVLLLAATMRAQYTFGPEVQSTNSASITYKSGTGAFQYADAALFSENHAALPLRGTAATFITTSNEWTASVTVNISARSMTVAEGTS